MICVWVSEIRPRSRACRSVSTSLAPRGHGSATGGSLTTLEARRARFSLLARYVLATTPEGRDGLRRVVEPGLADLVDELRAADPPQVWTWQSDFRFAGTAVPSWSTWIAITDSNGALAGYCCLMKPAAAMSEVAAA